MKNSEKYWREREEKARKKHIKEEKEYRKKIESIYRSMRSEINDQILAFYQKYAKDEGLTMSEVKKKCRRLDIEEFAKKAKKYVKEKDFSDQANEEMKIYNLTMKVNRLELLKAQLGLELVAGTDEIAKFLEKELEGRTIEELEKQAGILGHSLVDNQRLVHSIVNASFYHATFSDRIWTNQANLKSELDKILQTALIQGRNPKEFIPHIRKAFDVNVNQAYRLLVTELARVQTDAQMKSFKKNGFGQYTFHALGNACDLCKELDGKHFDVEEGESGKNMPPMHPHCRCSTSAYMDDEDYESWLDGYKEHGLSWEEWIGIHKSGALSGAWTDENDPLNRKREYIAKDLYMKIKNRKKSYEIKAVSNHSGLSIEEIERVYNHIFVRNHLFKNGKIRKFDPDYYMAHSWLRLREGKNIQKHDITMLYHELEEEKIMGESLDIFYEDVHKEVEKKYNYRQDLLEYLKDHDV